MALTTAQAARIVQIDDLQTLLLRFKSGVIDPIDKSSIGEITLQQLNEWGASSDTNANAAAALAQIATTAAETNCLGGKRRKAYTVTKDLISMGLLFVYGDNMGHGAYEVFQTSQELENGQIGNTHVDGKLYTYYRFLPFEAHNGTTKGVWTEWKPIVEQQDLSGIEAKLSEHDAKLFPSSLSLHSSAGTLIEEDGTAKTTNITVTAARKGVAVSPAELSVKKDGTTISQLTGVALSHDHNRFTATAKVEGQSVSASIDVRLMPACRYGASSKTALATSDISALTKQSVSLTPPTSYSTTNQANNWYLWLVVPNEMNIRKVSSGPLLVAMEAPVTVTFQGATFKAYRSSDMIAGNASLNHNFDIQ